MTAGLELDPEDLFRSGEHLVDIPGLAALIDAIPHGLGGPHAHLVRVVLHLANGDHELQLLMDVHEHARCRTNLVVVDDPGQVDPHKPPVAVALHRDATCLGRLDGVRDFPVAPLVQALELLYILVGHDLEVEHLKGKHRLALSTRVVDGVVNLPGIQGPTPI